jgi:RHS repeat-associated protein
MMDMAGSVVGRAAYTPFGDFLNRQGVMMNDGMMGFSSMPQTHGVVFYPLRPFVPGGPTRWLTRDPIGERGGLNLYGFVGNNPMSFVDPYGLDSFVPGVNGSRENSLPALTLTGTPGGAVSASYPGPDSFVIGGLAIAGVGGVAAVVEDPVQALFVAAAILDAKYPPQSNLTLGVMPSWMGGPRAKCPTRGFGNIGGGKTTVEEALKQAEKWLGPGYREVAPGVFRSADDARQFRMTFSDLSDPDQGAHVHFEVIASDGRTILENSHVGVSNP